MVERLSPLTGGVVREASGGFSPLTGGVACGASGGCPQSRKDSQNFFLGFVDKITIYTYIHTITIYKITLLKC